MLRYHHGRRRQLKVHYFSIKTHLQSNRDREDVCLGALCNGTGFEHDDVDETTVKLAWTWMRLRKDSERYKINEWRMCATLVCNLQTNPHLNGTTNRKWWNKHARQHHKLWLNENCVPFIPFLFDCHSTRWFSAFVLSARCVASISWSFDLWKFFKTKKDKKIDAKSDLVAIAGEWSHQRRITNGTQHLLDGVLFVNSHQTNTKTVTKRRNGGRGGGQATTKTRRTFSEWMNEMDRFCFRMGIFTARRTKKSYKTRKTS